MIFTRFLYIWTWFQIYIIRLLQYISAFSHLLPLSLFLIYLHRNRKYQTRVIFFYCLYSFINDWWILALASNEIVLVSLSVFTVLEFSFFSVFIYSLLENAVVKKSIIIVSIFFIICCIFVYFNFRNSPLDTIPTSIEAIIIITYTIYFLYEQNNKREICFI